MNKHAMLHIMDSAYCFPVSEDEITIRFRTAKEDVEKVWIIFENKYVIGQTQQRLPMEKKCSGELYDYYSITLKPEDTRLAYVFYLYDGESYYYFSEDGLSTEYDFTVGFYNFFQYPYINSADIHRQVEWTKDAVFYQIFVDRFCVGDEEGDKSYVNCKWGEIPTPKSFAGGDLKGIIKKLDHIKELGANTIYLTPVFTSKSNHKYDISDYYQIDKHFGENEDLHRLIDTAHAKGMRIVLDAVFNHCSEELTQFRDVVDKGRDSKYYDWFVIRGDKPCKEKGNYEMFASCTYMPKFNTSNEEVQKYLIDIACHYIDVYHIDGWRLDVSDEVSHDFWRMFRKEVKRHNPECVILGENWHDASNYLRGDQYDGIMNYAFTKACLDFFAWGKMDAQQLSDKLSDILMRNTDTVNRMMLNLLDSHDTHRFYTEVGMDTQRMHAALALLYLFPGMPCVYYGTETLMQGGYDPDCRRCMDWEGIGKGQYQETISYLQMLGRLRETYAISEAETKLEAQDGVFVLRRLTNRNEIVLYINVQDKEAVADGRRIAPHSHELIVNGGKVCE